MHNPGFGTNIRLPPARETTLIMTAKPVRIAMWSGPRNISTALMRSFGNRPDAIVCDEPFYAHYLQDTGYQHPAHDQIREHHETDWRKVVQQLTGGLPSEKSVWYQKHMAHHMLDHIDREWMLGPEFQHAFLIRDPEEMLLSLIKILPDVTLPETGLPQQLEIFQLVRSQTDHAPAVVRARDVLEAPERILQRLCSALSIQFDNQMLCWPTGSRETDGVWAEHWYGRVNESTGFGSYMPKTERLPERFHTLLKECQDIYSQLEPYRIQAN